MKDPLRKQEEIKRLLESNKNKKTAYQNFRDRLRQREGHLQLQVFIRKERCLPTQQHGAEHSP